MVPKRRSQYNRNGNTKPSKKKIEEQTTTTTSDTMTTANNTNPGDDKNEDSHDKFLDSAKKSLKPNEVTLEPTNEPLTNPHSQKKIHREEALDGISNKPKEHNTAGAGGNNNPPPPPSTPASTPEGEDLDFNPTPPAPDDAPEGPKNPIPGTSNPPIETEPFTIPSGSAEDLIDQAAEALNYLVEQHGDMVMGIKIHQDYYLVPKVVPLILEQNKRNNDRIKLSPTEVAMLKKPLVKLMQAKGIRGLTPGEELAAVGVIILVSKIKAAVQIRSENKKLSASFMHEINQLRQEIRKNAEATGQNTASNKTSIADADLELTPTEEV